MKKVSFITVVMALTAVLFSGAAQAGVPFINHEGVGGAAFNPLAYPALSSQKEGEGLKVGPIDIGKPRIGMWHINLNGTDIGQTTIGIADTFGKRLELSYGYESVAVAGLAHSTHKSNIGAKLLILEENSFGTKFVPAVSVGTIYKTTTQPLPGAKDSGTDYYLVATKMIPELPRPVLLSAGVLSTKGQITGILGFNDERKECFFANIDVLPINELALGFEYRQGPSYSNFKQADHWNVHAAWFVNKNLTLITAYANAGDSHSTTSVGLGGGPVVSLQYEF